MMSASPAAMALRGMLSNLAEAGVLHQCQSRLFLDGPQSHRAVRAHAGQDNANACSLPVFGQRAQKEINGETQAAGRRRFEQMQHTVQNGHVLVGRNHIDAVGFDPHPVSDLKNLHRGGALEQFVHDPLVGRVQVLDDDKGHAAVFRHMPQELFEASNPPAEAPMPTMGKRRLSVWAVCLLVSQKFFYAASSPQGTARAAAANFANLPVLFFKTGGHLSRL